MARSQRSSDSFELLLRGGAPAPAAAPRGTARRDEANATERFGWGAANAGGPADADAGSGQAGPLHGGAPAHPGPAHPGYGGYTTAVEPLAETVLLRTRPHARRLVLPVLVLFATVTAYGWYGWRLPEEWQNWTAFGAACGLVFFVVLLPFLAWLGHRYTVTSRRVIARRGLLVRHRQDVYLARVSDVRLRRGPLQAAFGTGDVRVIAGPELTLVLHDVPSARLVAELLGELTEHPGQGL
ncbi:PH domain-containing protein [Herbiconiux sp. 11R-BC]|uniref:PH domain-containing protein n=1 Tax=Herbiconiux sp. 11R-BC TaxID=3111637 RepID=UPI003C09BEB2